MRKKGRGKRIGSVNRGQVTLFVIVALILVGAVIVLLLWPSIKGVFVREMNPETYVKECTEEAVDDAIGIAGKRGGSLNPQFFYLFEGDNVEYLCYTNEYYKTCVMQQPMLLQHLEYEINNYAKPRIEGCVNELKSELEKRGYRVSSKRPDVTTSIVPGIVKVNVNLGMNIQKETGANYENIKVNVKSEIYDLIMIASSILNYEARMGDSDPLGYMFYYPDVKIQKLKQEDGTKVYILENRDTGEVFRFASRSLSWPPGLTGEDNLMLYPGRTK